MIRSYAVVTERGQDTGSNVTLKWKDIQAVEQLYDWDFNSREVDGEGNMSPPGVRLIEGCCKIYVGRHEFSVRADYNELVGQLRELDESELFED